MYYASAVMLNLPWVRSGNRMARCQPCRFSCTLYVPAAPPGCNLFPRPPTSNSRTYHRHRLWFKMYDDWPYDSGIKSYLNFGRCYVHNFVGKLVFCVGSVEFNHSKPRCRQNLCAVCLDFVGLTGHHLSGVSNATG